MITLIRLEFRMLSVNLPECVRCHQTDSPPAEQPLRRASSTFPPKNGTNFCDHSIAALRHFFTINWVIEIAVTFMLLITFDQEYQSYHIPFLHNLGYRGNRKYRVGMQCLQRPHFLSKFKRPNQIFYNETRR